MKKKLALILALIMLFSSGAAYAEQLGNNTFYEKQLSGYRTSGEWQQRTAYLRERAEVIRQNLAEIKKLQDEIRNKLSQVKAKTKQLKQNPDSLSKEKVSEIREKLALVRSDRSELGRTGGLIGGECLKLRMHKRSRDFQGALKSLNTICKIQEKRIQILKKLNSDLDALLMIF